MASDPQPLIRVPSTDGVVLAVHDLGGTPSQTMLVAHATGFNAHCYTPLSSALADRFRTFGLDFRGHGHTPVDPLWSADWTRFGDDALAAAEAVAPDGGLVGFGHSMGGAALLMAAHRDPARFDRLVLFEPISHQARTPTVTPDEMRLLPIVQGALRRRRRFGSTDEAYENYAAKPPLSIMVPQALRGYVDHGFRAACDEKGAPEVELCCSPELEAGIFMTGVDNGVWTLLPEIATPCTVIAGHVEESQPSAQTEAIADRLPNGTFVLLDHQSHFGPFSHPLEIAEIIAG